MSIEFCFVLKWHMFLTKRSCKFDFDLQSNPNCYKWLATQQSNSMLLFGNQNRFPSSFAPLRDLLKALMILSNLNRFNSSPSPLDQRFAQRKDSSKVWKEKGSKSPFLSLPLWLCITCLFCHLVFKSV